MSKLEGYVKISAETYSELEWRLAEYTNALSGLNPAAVKPMYEALKAAVELAKEVGGLHAHISYDGTLASYRAQFEEALALAEKVGEA
jgi:hypothetical protein